MRDDGGLGTHLIGDRIMINGRTVSVTKLLGEGEETDELDEFSVLGLVLIAEQNLTFRCFVLKKVDSRMLTL